MAISLTSIPLRSEYKGLPSLTDQGVSKSDWKDSDMIKQRKYILRQVDEDTICKIIDEVFPRLETGISERDAAKVILLGWNLIAPSPTTFKHVYPKDTTSRVFYTALDKEIDDISDSIIDPTGVTSSIIYPTKTLEKAQCGTYLCASLLRLFTKDRENYKKAQASIKKSYSNFHIGSFKIQGFEVRAGVIDVLHHLYHTNPMYKSTFGACLYYFSSLTDNQGMVKLLFEMHVQNTGMTSYPLLRQACNTLKADPEVFMSACHHGLTKRALIEIAKIVSTFETPSQEELAKEFRDKYTYKYARLYNQTMFASLQNKECTDLLMLLGHIVNTGKRKGTSNILEMAVLKDIPIETKNQWKFYALRIRDLFVSSTEAAENNPIFLTQSDNSTNV